MSTTEIEYKKEIKTFQIITQLFIDDLELLLQHIAWPVRLDPQLALPPDMWTLMKIGLGGYVTGRSAEKIAKVMTGKGIIERVTGK